MAARFQRQHCFLCDLPHSPWAILHDFSEPICRGCCNYEGAERIEEIIQYGRILRKNWENSEANRSRGVKSERLNSTGSSVSSTPSPPPGLNNGGSNFNASAEQRHAFGKYQNAHHIGEESAENMHQNVSGQHQKINSPESMNGSKGGPVRVGKIGTRDDRRGSNYPEETRHGMLNGNAIVTRSHPGPLAGPLAHGPPHVALEAPRQEHIQAHATITILNRVVPFDIRFKKDHNLVGRIFAFDVNNKPGMEFELKIFVEYPRGSGCVFQSASGVAKQMHTEFHKDIGRGISSGYKYLEYEVDRSTGEWRPLASLLQESVRYFREHVIQELLPRPQLDAEFPLPNVNLSFNPRPGTLYGRKRKGTMDLEEYEIATGKRGIPIGRPLREDVMQPHPAWIQNQVEAGKLIVNSAGMPLPPGTPVSTIPSASVSPMVTTPVTKVSGMQLPGNEGHGCSQSKSPITPAMRGSHFDGPPGVTIREEGRPSSLVTSPNASGCVSPHRRSPRPPPGPISKAAETQSSAIAEGEGKDKSAAVGQNILRCSLCHDKLEDTHFVQCPSIMHHKFCFPCSRDSIKKQGAGAEVFCPSGERCPLQGSNLPWAFMQGEIATILGTEFAVKKEKESQ